MNSPALAESPSPQTPVISLTTPLVISCVLTAGLFALSAWAWQQLPADARIPIHWNGNGQVNGYGGRGMLFLMPGMVLGLTLLFMVLPRIEPRRVHLQQSFKAYRAVWLAVLGLLSGTHVLMVQAALGKAVSMDKFMFIGVGLLLAIMGNFLGKVRSNFVFGVRTPWTLGSELSWNKTHRLAGRLFVAFGLLMLTAAIAQVPGNYMVTGLLALLPVLLITIFAYSYAVWRNDPNKTPLGSKRN